MPSPTDTTPEDELILDCTDLSHSQVERILKWQKSMQQALLRRLMEQATSTFIAPTHGVPLSALETELKALEEAS